MCPGKLSHSSFIPLYAVEYHGKINGYEILRKERSNLNKGLRRKMELTRLTELAREIEDSTAAAELFKIIESVPRLC